MEPKRPDTTLESTIAKACFETLRRLRPDLEPHLVGRTRVLGWLPGQPWARGLPLAWPGWRGVVSDGGVMLAEHP